MHSTAYGMHGLFLVPRRRKIARLPLSDALNRRSVEALVMQAYFQLIRVAWSERGSRSIALAKYGNYEVRLVERKPADNADVSHLWVKLYAKDTQTSVEARGCDDLEAAAMAAEEIMSKAEQLENNSRGNPGKNNPARTTSGD